MGFVGLYPGGLRCGMSRSKSGLKNRSPFETFFVSVKTCILVLYRSRWKNLCKKRVEMFCSYQEKAYLCIAIQKKTIFNIAEWSSW